MADEETKEEGKEEKKKGGGNPLMIVLIVLIVILIGAVGVGGWFVYNKLNNPEDDSKEKTQKEEAGDSKEFFKAEIKDLVLNITNAKGRAKLMKLSFAIKSVEPTIAAVVEDNKAEIVDVVINQIAARSSEELLTVGGKELLKEELLEELNIVINEATATNEEIKRNSIRKIFFTSFVIK